MLGFVAEEDYHHLIAPSVNCCKNKECSSVYDNSGLLQRQSEVHIPFFPLSLCVSFLECPVLFPLSLTPGSDFLTPDTAELPLGADQQSVACAMLTLETHDTLQISSLADTSSGRSEQDKYQPLLSNNCSNHNRVSSHILIWVMHLRCHFKNLPSSKQSKTCFH